MNAPVSFQTAHRISNADIVFNYKYKYQDAVKNFNKTPPDDRSPAAPKSQ
jgi:hypothetical protein